MKQRPTLVLLYAPDPGSEPGNLRVFVPDRGLLTIGRSPDADMTIPDARTSRMHAEVRWSENRVYVKDLSQNGTSVDGARLETGELVDGDVIRLGDSFVILRFESTEDVSDVVVEEINGISPAMREVRRCVEATWQSAGAVRLGGPPGVGKRAVARLIHRRSGRPGELVTIDDAERPDLTRALEEAANGSLYIANASSLSPEIRAALADPKTARIIVGTRRKLDGEDLFAHQVMIPPLRSRREDILPYVLRIVNRPAVDLAPELVGGLLRHLWPYNVRELSKVASALKERGQGKRVLQLELVRDGLAFIGGSADETLPATDFRALVDGYDD